MGTLWTELGTHVARWSGGPRVYADANIPHSVVAFMRARLKWDVFYVLEHDDLRRASDDDHYRLARRLSRTLVTLDRDFFNDRRFPPAESGGVIVFWAPDERALTRLLRVIDTRLFRDARHTALPLAGRKVFWPAGQAHFEERRDT